MTKTMVSRKATLVDHWEILKERGAVLEDEVVTCGRCQLVLIFGEADENGHRYNTHDCPESGGFLADAS